MYTKKILNSIIIKLNNKIDNKNKRTKITSRYMVKSILYKTKFYF